MIYFILSFSPQESSQRAVPAGVGLSQGDSAMRLWKDRRFPARGFRFCFIRDNRQFPVAAGRCENVLYVETDDIHFRFFIFHDFVSFQFTPKKVLAAMLYQYRAVITSCNVWSELANTLVMYSPALAVTVMSPKVSVKSFSTFAAGMFAMSK